MKKTSKSKPRKSKSTGARKGGKAGNQNARKHGLYAKKQPTPEKEGETKIETNKIFRRREILDDVIETLYKKFHSLNDVDQMFKCANSISIAATSANGCDRTLAIVSGKLTDLASAIEQLFLNEDPNDSSTIE